MHHCCYCCCGPGRCPGLIRPPGQRQLLSRQPRAAQQQGLLPDAGGGPPDARLRCPAAGAMHRVPSCLTAGIGASPLLQPNGAAAMSAAMRPSCVATESRVGQQQGRRHLFKERRQLVTRSSLASLRVLYSSAATVRAGQRMLTARRRAGPQAWVHDDAGCSPARVLQRRTRLLTSGPPSRLTGDSRQLPIGQTSHSSSRGVQRSSTTSTQQRTPPLGSLLSGCPQPSIAEFCPGSLVLGSQHLCCVPACCLGTPLAMEAAVSAPPRTTLSVAIWAAAERGDTATVDGLLDDEGYPGPDCRSVNQSTLLHCAAKLGHLQLAATLLARGANVNALDYGGMRRTPLHWVSSQAAGTTGVAGSTHPPACSPASSRTRLPSSLPSCPHAARRPGAPALPRHLGGPLQHAYAAPVLCAACAGLQGRPRGHGGAADRCRR